MQTQFSMKKILASTVLALFSFSLFSASPVEKAQSQQYYWLKIKALDQFERSVLANEGVAIEMVSDDYVISYGNEILKNQLQKSGRLLASSSLDLENKMRGLDFPKEDEIYHNYSEMTAALTKVAKENPDIVKLSSIGKTVEGRDIWGVQVTSDFANAPQKPAAIFMGGHHAREHLSVEMPIKFIQYLADQYRAGNARIVGLVNNRDIHIIPAVNPDGLEFDVATSKYKMWRKNRTKNRDGTFGVDLNRNYGFQWGTGGSSSSPSSDTYMGTQPFSEPETRAIRDYVEAHDNITILLSFHSFSKLILFPWGHKSSGIEIAKDKLVHEKMAEKMSTWNGYKPQQSSGLYIASGDTTDWSYGQHKIFSFTFELDPANSGFGGSDGFYPGPSAIQASFNKNLEPMLYLLDYSDNPYRVTNVGIGPINP